MAAFLYNSARSGFATGALNWPTLAINAMLVSPDYSALPSNNFVSDINPGAIIVRDIALTGLAQVNGVCSGLIPQFNALFDARTVKALVLYVKGVSDAVSQLIYYSADGAGFPFSAQGFNYAVLFDQTVGGWFQV